jgi:hypothetical protein
MFVAEDAEELRRIRLEPIMTSAPENSRPRR